MTVQDAIKELELEFPYKESSTDEDYIPNCISLSIENITALINKYTKGGVLVSDVFEYLKQSDVEIGLSHSSFSIVLTANILVDTPVKAQMVEKIVFADIEDRQQKQQDKAYNHFAEALGYMASYFKSLTA